MHTCIRPLAEFQVPQQADVSPGRITHAWTRAATATDRCRPPVQPMASTSFRFPSALYWQTTSSKRAGHLSKMTQHEEQSQNPETPPIWKGEKPVCNERHISDSLQRLSAMQLSGTGQPHQKSHFTQLEFLIAAKPPAPAVCRSLQKRVLESVQSAIIRPPP